MNNLQLKAERAELLKQIVKRYPEWTRIDNKARRLAGSRSRHEVWLEQGAAIALLASQYNRKSAQLLEIGTYRGYSAALMALAAPKAQVTTLEPHRVRRAQARQNIGSLGVSVRPQVSTAWLERATAAGLRYDFIFVDGDHDAIRDDLPYWNLLKRNGLFLHHDYSPPGSKRECPVVWEALNTFALQLGHPMDVLVQDDTGVGLAGFYRRDVSEVWPPTQGSGEAVMVLDEGATL